MRAGRSVRKDVVDTSHLLGQRGWVANHDGNITVRLSDNCFLATPTATAKSRVTDSLLIEVDGQGKRVSGTARPFGELDLHLVVYQRRDDIGAVIHAHPPHATAIACSAGNPIECPFIAEAVVSIGAHIPKLPFAMPGPDARRVLAAAVDDVDAVLLENHGVMAWGADLEQAYLRLELVEHLARIAVLAQPLGGVRPLPEAVIAPLLQRRAAAGLGKAASKSASQPAISTPRPASPASPIAATERAQLVRVIREELLSVVKGSK